MPDLATSLAVLMAIAAILLFTPRWRWGRAIAASVALIFALLGATPLPQWLLRPLEDRFSALNDTAPRADVIVVLGGIAKRRGRTVLYSSGIRPLAGLQLARRLESAVIVVSGGAPNDPGAGTATEAAAAADLLLDLGFPPERLILEDRSRTTHENAVETAQLLRPRSGACWLLVTSAFHMPRAVAAFRAAGASVVPYPVDYRTAERSEGFRWHAVGVAAGLSLADTALHEWAGLLWYRATRKTREFFPKPEISAQGCRG